MKKTPTFKQIGDLMSNGHHPKGLKQLINNLFDTVYEITHEFSDSETIESLIDAHCRGRELNEEIIKIIISYKKRA